MSNTRKHYVGDIKWVLYNYVCDLNSDFVTFRCGRYAYDKLMRSVVGKASLVLADSAIGTVHLNGEKIIALLVDDFDKKQLVISSHQDVFEKAKDVRTISKTIYDDDIVLYFA